MTNTEPITGRPSAFKRLRDALQQGIYAVINPFVRGMVKIGITPNMVTTIGFLGNVGAAVLFILAAPKTPAENPDFLLILWGGIVLTAFSLFDMLDGQVARLGNMCSRFGALYDSVLDRYSELVTLGSLTYFFMLSGEIFGALITFIALIGSVMVSYVRARAEGLDIECKVGLMQRPERVVVTFLAAIVAGAVGMGNPENADAALWILIGAMAVIAVFANFTAFARIAHCKKKLN